MMRISVLQPTDIERLSSIQPPTWYDIKPIHQFYVQAPHCYPFKFEIEGEMVGVGTVIFHDDVAWMAHILVHENHRKKGIGRAISEHVLQTALDRGIKTGYLIATDMGEPVYAKIGFKVETEYLVYKNMELTLTDKPDEHIKPYREEYKTAILALDKAISGENRIDDLLFYLKSAEVYMKDEVIEGVYVPEFGEGLIIAKTPEAGKALMHKRLQGNETALFPKDNTEAQAFMTGLNVEPSGAVPRMYYGEKRPIKLSGIYNRIGGNLG